MSDEPKRDLPAGGRKTAHQIAGAALRENSANPERIGCPDPSAVEAAVAGLNFPGLVDRRRSHRTCAPCFEQYNRQRQRLRIRMRAPRLGCVVVSCSDSLATRPGEGPKLQEPLQQVSAPVLIATLDYGTGRLTAQISAIGPH